VLPTGLHLPIILGNPCYRDAIVELGPLSTSRIDVQQSLLNIWKQLASKSTPKDQRVRWESKQFSYSELVAHHHQQIWEWLRTATYRIAQKHHCLVIAGADFLCLPWREAKPVVVPQIIANPPQWHAVHQMSFRAEMLGAQSVLGYQTTPGRVSWDTAGLVQTVKGTGFHYDDVVRLLNPEQADHPRSEPYYSADEERGAHGTELREQNLLAVCLAQTKADILPHSWTETVMNLPNGPDILATARLYGEPFSSGTDLGSISVRGRGTSLAHPDVSHNYAWWSKTIR